MPPSPTLDFEKNPGFLRPGESADQYSARNTGLGDTPISSSALAPATPMNIPPAPAASGAAGLEGQLSEFAKQYQAQAAEAQKAKEQSGKDLANSLFGTQGEASLTNDLYSRAGGVDETQRELQDINQQLLQEQEGFRREVETIQDNAEGLTRGAVAGRIDESRRKSLRTQADLSVIQLSKQGKFDSAKAIADRAIAVQLEKDKQRNDILKFIYEENKDLFDKAEQRAFTVAQGERERALDREEQNLKTISDLSLNALKNGAPSSIASQMRKAATVEDAISIGGQYVDKYDRAIQQLQLENIRSQINERAAANTVTGPISAVTGKPLSAEERKALGFAERSMSASLIIDGIGDQFSGVFSQLPLPNLLKNSDRQKFEQAQRNFVNAVLRRESGAVINPEEFDNARLQYFPQPGDGADVLVQKQMNRNQVIKNLLVEGGQNTSIQDAGLADPLGLGVTPSSINPLGI